MIFIILYIVIALIVHLLLLIGVIIVDVFHCLYKKECISIFIDRGSRLFKMGKRFYNLIYLF